MKIAIMQPYIFPYIGYFQLIHAVDKFIIYDDVNFIKQGWINRNRILVADKANYITVPLTNGSSFTQIKDVTISTNNQWKSTWLKTIYHSYSKASYFKNIFPIIESTLNEDHTFISQLALSSIKAICNYLEISTSLAETSIYYNNHHLKGQERVLDICKQEKCDQYINAIGGNSLYSKEDFQEHSIILKFIQPREIIYQQLTSSFVPWLSIIDILMCNSKKQTQNFLNHYDFL